MDLSHILHGLGVAAQHLVHPEAACPVDHEETLADEALDDDLLGGGGGKDLCQYLLKKMTRFRLSAKIRYIINS